MSVRYLVKYLVNVEFQQKAMVMITGERLSEEVGGIVSRRDLLEYDCFRVYEFSNVMMPNIDMLDLRVILCVLRQCDSPLIIAPYNPWSIVFNGNLI